MKIWDVVKKETLTEEEKAFLMGYCEDAVLVCDYPLDHILVKPYADKLRRGERLTDKDKQNLREIKSAVYPRPRLFGPMYCKQGYLPREDPKRLF